MYTQQYMYIRRLKLIFFCIFLSYILKDPFRHVYYLMKLNLCHGGKLGAITQHWVVGFAPNFQGLFLTGSATCQYQKLDMFEMVHIPFKKVDVYHLKFAGYFGSMRNSLVSKLLNLLCFHWGSIEIVNADSMYQNIHTHTCYHWVQAKSVSGTEHAEQYSVLLSVIVINNAC